MSVNRSNRKEMTYRVHEMLYEVNSCIRMSAYSKLKKAGRGMKTSPFLLKKSLYSHREPAKAQNSLLRIIHFIVDSCFEYAIIFERARTLRH